MGWGRRVGRAARDAGVSGYAGFFRVRSDRPRPGPIAAFCGRGGLPDDKTVRGVIVSEQQGRDF